MRQLRQELDTSPTSVGTSTYWFWFSEEGTSPYYYSYYTNYPKKK